MNTPYETELRKQINHSVQYYDKETGACTNQAESFFSRMRRAEFGINHHFAGNYLAAYANEMAYREDNCREDNRSIYEDITSRALKKTQSKAWCGYWQKHLKAKEVNALNIAG